MLRGCGGAPIQEQLLPDVQVAQRLRRVLHPEPAQVHGCGSNQLRGALCCLYDCVKKPVQWPLRPM